MGSCNASLKAASAADDPSKASDSYGGSSASGDSGMRYTGSAPYGAASPRDEESDDDGELGDEGSDGIPPFFAEILAKLASFEAQLGGVKNFGGRPRIQRKVKACDFRNIYTDFEYVYLTVLGFAKLHMHCEEIINLNNGRKFTQNPGVKILERRTGMTMHADRDGANHLLRSAPASLLEAFEAAQKERNGLKVFFKDAFDRTADPCLEGRAGRIMEYLQKRSSALNRPDMPPWEDMGLQFLPEGSKPEVLVGEHLRVFKNECTWRWAKERGISYEKAKAQRDEDGNGFESLYNASTFEAALLSRGIASDVPMKQWQVQLENGTWSPYEAHVNEALEMARLQGAQSCRVKLRSWWYEVNLKTAVQRNPKTGKERPVRCVDVTAVGGRLMRAEVKKAIDYFVDLATLPKGREGGGSMSTE